MLKHVDSRKCNAVSSSFFLIHRSFWKCFFSILQTYFRANTNSREILSAIQAYFVARNYENTFLVTESSSFYNAIFHIGKTHFGEFKILRIVIAEKQSFTMAKILSSVRGWNAFHPSFSLSQSVSLALSLCIWMRVFYSIPLFRAIYFW